MESPSGTTLHIIYLIVFISKFLGDLCWYLILCSIILCKLCGLNLENFIWVAYAFAKWDDFGTINVYYVIRQFGGGKEGPLSIWIGTMGSANWPTVLHSAALSPWGASFSD
jgi:hypothetical protein